MNDSLTEALHHVQHRCLKRRLFPLSLRHAFSLAVAESPFFTGDAEEITLDDLRQAVEICARPGDFFLEGAQSSILKRDWRRFRTRKADPASEILRFHAYLGDYCSTPQVWARGEGTPLKVNWIFSTVAGLMVNLGMSREDAWELSPGEAQWLIVAGAEQNPASGSPDVMSDEEAEVIELMRSMEDEPEGDED